MKKTKPCQVGIDVSQKFINVHFGEHDTEYLNNRKGWKQMLSETPPNSEYIMEATGNYHVKLALYLSSNGLKVKVINPLRLNHWVKSLSNGKASNDLIAASDISEFATDNAAKLKEWDKPNAKQLRARAIVTLLAGISKLERAAGNIQHSVSLVVSKTDSILQPMEFILEAYKEQKQALEKELCKLAKYLYPKQFSLLTTIKGLGEKTVSVMLVCTKGMTCENFRQLSSYVGVVPYVKESGTSVKSKGHLVKTGNPYLRSLLFMCSFTAIRHNKPCTDLYNRLVERGKPKMLALVAVMHRLVKISFGVVQSNEPFRGGYLATIPA